MPKQKTAAEPDYADALGEIIASLTRLRGMIDDAKLPGGEARQDLVTHLALASIAAHRFRLISDDDIIALDE